MARIGRVATVQAAVLESRVVASGRATDAVRVPYAR